MPAFNDLTGKRFGRLLVQEKDTPVFNTYGRPINRWKCLCDCGNTSVVRVSKLNSGQTTSCGCYRIEQSIKAVKKHGLRHTRSYDSWASMKDRCLNPKSVKYDLWGGRGIKVCDRWINSFAAFHEDMGPRPDGCTLDRIDNNGNYEPGNCRWATPLQQSNNLRTTRFFELSGVSKTISEWATVFGCSRDAVKLRLKRGQNIEQIAAAFGAI